MTNPSPLEVSLGMRVNASISPDLARQLIARSGESRIIHFLSKKPINLGNGLTSVVYLHKEKLDYGLMVYSGKEDSQFVYKFYPGDHFSLMRANKIFPIAKRANFKRIQKYTSR